MMRHNLFHLVTLIGLLSILSGPAAAESGGDAEAASTPTTPTDYQQDSETETAVAGDEDDPEEADAPIVAIYWDSLEGFKPCDDPLLENTPLCNQCEGQTPEGEYGNSPISMSESGIYVGGPARGNEGSHDGLFGPYKQVVNLDPNGCG